MTPELTIRSFTNDQYALDRAFYSNFYRLKPLKNGSVVLDLGAHCGYFSFAAISLGADRIYSFEIHPENYKILLRNLRQKPFDGKITSFNFGVYTENIVLEFYNGENIDNTYVDWSELNTSKPNEKVYNAPVFSLDYILDKLIKEQIDILKLNIGYAEIDILNNSQLIESKVNNICFETKEDILKVNKFIEDARQKGFKDSKINKISEEENLSFLVFLSKTKCEDYFLI